MLAAPSEESGIRIDELLHIRQVPQDAEKIAQVRQMLADEDAGLLASFQHAATSLPVPGDDTTGFVDGHCIWRYLVARNGDCKKASAMLLDMLRWRREHRPQVFRAAEFENEGLTGKVRLTGKDRHGRPVIVLDNTVENTRDVDAQMRHLAWHLERATRRMREGVQKYFIFIHFENFSLWNAPPMKASRETLKLLQLIFAERLGHVVGYRVPLYFHVFYAALKPFIDAKTESKVVLIRNKSDDAAFAPGSANDDKMRALVGDQWRELCGVDQPTKAGSACGFDQPTYWAEVQEEQKAWAEAVAAAGGDAGAGAAPPLAPSSE